MTKEERRRLEIVAENGPEEKANEAMKKLKEINKTYHWCPDWDDMVICDEHKEIECCLCMVEFDK